jgi:hypothetical protein
MEQSLRIGAAHCARAGYDVAPRHKLRDVKWEQLWSGPLDSPRQRCGVTTTARRARA